MMPVGRYDSYKLNRGYIYFVCGLLLLLVGIGIFAAGSGVWCQGSGPPAAVILLWLGVLGWVAYYYLRIPVEISFQGQDALVFKGLIGSSEVAVRDIISMKATALKPGFIVIKHRGGTIRLLCQITGLYELIYLMKQINPEIEIQGC